MMFRGFDNVVYFCNSLGLLTAENYSISIGEISQAQ